MRSSLLTLAVAATAAIAAPVANVKRATTTTDIDPVIIQYALTLEHLEAAFYNQSLNNYDAAAFEAAGFEPWVRLRLSEIASHEKNHVTVLSGALQAANITPTEACTYEFGFTGPASVLATAQVLEGVGVAAYAGAAADITNPDYLTLAAQILAVEARHAAWVRGAAQNGDSFPTPYDATLNYNQTYSLAAQFITACPSTNPALPVAAFPALTASAGPYAAGDKVKLTWDNSAPGAYAVFISGLNQTPVAFDADGMVVIPEDAAGQVYVVISSTNGTVTDAGTLAGPAVIEVPVQATLFDY